MLVSYCVSQPVSQLISRSVSRSDNLCVGEPVSKRISMSVCQSVTVSQSVSQLVDNHNQSSLYSRQTLTFHDTRAGFLDGVPAIPQRTLGWRLQMVHHEITTIPDLKKYPLLTALSFKMKAHSSHHPPILGHRMFAVQPAWTIRPAVKLGHTFRGHHAASLLRKSVPAWL